MMSLAVQSLSLEPHYKMNFNLLYYVASIHQTAVSGVWCIRGFIGKGTRAHQVWSPESSTSFQSSQTRSLPSRGSECSGGKAGALTILPVRTCKRQRIPQGGRSSGVTVTVGTMWDLVFRLRQACVRRLTPPFSQQPTTELVHFTWNTEHWKRRVL